MDYNTFVDGLQLLKRKVSELALNKRVAVWGSGKEGKSTAELLDLLNESYDSFDAENQAELFHNLGEYDFVFKSPGISVFENRALIAGAKADADELKRKIVLQSEVFLSLFKNQTVGVNGTKGKSTTSSLIYQALLDGGYDARLIGNIGKAPFEELLHSKTVTPDTVFVFELSAHMMEFAISRPRLALLTNLFADHLDHYGSIEAYREAKLRMLPERLRPKFLDGSSTPRLFELNGEDYSEGEINLTEHFETPLIGEHNQLNIAASKAVVCDKFGVSEAAFRETVANFRGLKHRLERLEVMRNGKLEVWIDDSISTVPETTIAGMKAVLETEGQLDAVIIGGMERNVEMAPLIDFLAMNMNTAAILLPDSGWNIQPQLTEKGVKTQRAKNAASAVDLIRASSAQRMNDNVKNKLVVLLSPAAASYGFYKNFEARGDEFQSMVLA